MDDLTTERSFALQATWVIGVLDLFLDKLSMSVCTTKHWQTSGRLVQDLDVCTVVSGELSSIFELMGHATQYKY